jgi:hypothetical protein
LFRDLARDEKSVPEAILKDPAFRVPEALLEGEGDAEYRDPLAAFDHPAAERYDRRWLAASARVEPPIGAGRHSESGLVVLVQSDYQSVVRPARQLGEQFVKNSFWMFVVMGTVSLSLWYIVVRLFREPRAGLSHPPTPLPTSTPSISETTVLQRKNDGERGT